MSNLDTDEPIAGGVNAKKFPVVEIFGPTIQGEGNVAGTKTMFIRFGGCDFRCKKCDSLHAVIPEAVKVNSRRLTWEEIFLEVYEKALATGTKWVTLSGGNPAMWDLMELVLALRGKDIRVAVETQGSLWQDWFKFCDVVTLSPKSPGMGEKFDPVKFQTILDKIHDHRLDQMEASYTGKPVILGPQLALKIVIFSQQDIEFALEVGEMCRRDISRDNFYFSLGNNKPPVLMSDNKLNTWTGDDFIKGLLQDYRTLCEDILQDPRISHWRFLPQLHVLVWGNEGEK